MVRYISMSFFGAKFLNSKPILFIFHMSSSLSYTSIIDPEGSWLRFETGGFGYLSSLVAKISCCISPLIQILLALVFLFYLRLVLSTSLELSFFSTVSLLPPSPIIRGCFGKRSSGLPSSNKYGLSNSSSLSKLLALGWIFFTLSSTYWFKLRLLGGN